MMILVFTQLCRINKVSLHCIVFQVKIQHTQRHAALEPLPSKKCSTLPNKHLGWVWEIGFKLKTETQFRNVQ